MFTFKRVHGHVAERSSKKHSTTTENADMDDNDSSSANEDGNRNDGEGENRNGYEYYKDKNDNGEDESDGHSGGDVESIVSPSPSSTFDTDTLHPTGSDGQHKIDITKGFVCDCIVSCLFLLKRQSAIRGSSNSGKSTGNMVPQWCSCASKKTSLGGNLSGFSLSTGPTVPETVLHEGCEVNTVCYMQLDSPVMPTYGESKRKNSWYICSTRQETFVPSPTITTADSSQTVTSNESGSNTVAIALGIVFGVILLLLLIFFFLWICRKLKQRRAEEASANKLEDAFRYGLQGTNLAFKGYDINSNPLYAQE
eukprot:CFRG1917T1